MHDFLLWQHQYYAQCIKQKQEETFRIQWYNPITIKFGKTVVDSEGFYSPSLLKHLAGDIFKEQVFKTTFLEEWEKYIASDNSTITVWDLEIVILNLQRENFETITERAKHLYKKFVASKDFKYPPIEQKE